MRTRRELNRIADGLTAGTAFASWSVPEEQVAMVFIPILFLSEEQVKQMGPVVAFFEWMDKAGPRSINGMPCFFSMQPLLREEVLWIRKRMLRNLLRSEGWGAWWRAIRSKGRVRV